MERGTATCVLPTLIKYSAASQTFGHRHSRVSIVLQPPPPPHHTSHLSFFYTYTFRGLKIVHSKVCWWQIWSMSLPELQQLDQRPNNSLSASQNCTSSANVFRKGGIWNLGFKHHRKNWNLTIDTPTVLLELWCLSETLLCGSWCLTQTKLSGQTPQFFLMEFGLNSEIYVH